MKLEVARAAVIELRVAAKWYETQREGFGDAFLEVIDRTVTAIVMRPRAFALWRGSRVARSAVVKRFPYVVIFTIRNAETVRVLAFAHTRRRPGYWKKRR